MRESLNASDWLKTLASFGVGKLGLGIVVNYLRAGYHESYENLRAGAGRAIVCYLPSGQLVLRDWSSADRGYLSQQITYLNSPAFCKPFSP
jgi:hypothetical protein